MYRKSYYCIIIFIVTILIVINAYLLDIKFLLETKKQYAKQKDMLQRSLSHLELNKINSLSKKMSHNQAKIVKSCDDSLIILLLNRLQRVGIICFRIQKLSIENSMNSHALRLFLQFPGGLSELQQFLYVLHCLGHSFIINHLQMNNRELQVDCSLSRMKSDLPIDWRSLFSSVKNDKHWASSQFLPLRLTPQLKAQWYSFKQMRFAGRIGSNEVVVGLLILPDASWLKVKQGNIIGVEGAKVTQIKPQYILLSHAGKSYQIT